MSGSARPHAIEQRVEVLTGVPGGEELLKPGLLLCPGPKDLDGGDARLASASLECVESLERRGDRSVLPPVGGVLARGLDAVGERGNVLLQAAEDLLGRPGAALGVRGGALLRCGKVCPDLVSVSDAVETGLAVSERGEAQLVEPRRRLVDDTAELCRALGVCVDVDRCDAPLQRIQRCLVDIGRCPNRYREHLVDDRCPRYGSGAVGLDRDGLEVIDLGRARRGRWEAVFEAAEQVVEARVEDVSPEIGCRGVECVQVRLGCAARVVRARRGR